MGQIESLFLVLAFYDRTVSICYRNMDNKEKQAFYQECAVILGIEHQWNEPVKRRNRWNTRFVGNGRFPGFGLIRLYGSSVMITTRENGSKLYPTTQQALEALRSSVKDTS